MHPIEQLRFVARSRGIDPGLLVEEAADALGFFANEQRALITACRQLLSRQPGVGPLWWLCTRLVLAKDPRAEAQLVLHECWQFSPERLRGPAEGMPPNTVLVRAHAAGTDDGPDAAGQALVDQYSLRQIVEAESAGVAVWMVMGPGVWLPPIIWKEVQERCESDPSNDLTRLDLCRFSRIHTPDGVMVPGHLQPSTMMVAPELLVRLS